MNAVPDHTAVRTALWRAVHLRHDPAPHVFEDAIGLRLAAPGDDWERRPDMDPVTTAPMRAGIVARARFVEELLAERAVDQYVVLGAGLDTFAQRNPLPARELTIYEVDQPGPQEWKRQRLGELGFGVPDRLRLVPVDFETESWWDRLRAAGFDPDRPALVAATGVTMYLSGEANAAMLERLSRLAPGSVFVATFLLPIDLVDAEEQRLRRFAEDGARRSGTPFRSFFRPGELMALAETAGFAAVDHVSAAELAARYFAGRVDGLRPAESEQILVAAT